MRRQICLTTHTRNSTIHDAHTTTLDVRVSMMTHSPATDTTKDCIDRQSRYAGVSIHHDLVSGEAEDLKEREYLWNGRRWWQLSIHFERFDLDMMKLLLAQVKHTTWVTTLCTHLDSPRRRTAGYAGGKGIESKANNNDRKQGTSNTWRNIRRIHNIQGRRNDNHARKRKTTRGLRWTEEDSREETGNIKKGRRSILEEILRSKECRHEIQEYHGNTRLRKSLLERRIVVIDTHSNWNGENKRKTLRRTGDFSLSRFYSVVLPHNHFVNMHSFGSKSFRSDSTLRVASHHLISRISEGNESPPAWCVYILLWLEFTFESLFRCASLQALFRFPLDALPECLHLKANWKISVKTPSSLYSSRSRILSQELFL